MPPTKKTTKPPPDRQIDKFREAARSVETDESEEQFDRVLKRVVKSPKDRQKKGDAGSSEP